MLLEICLITAGLHAGRTLLQKLTGRAEPAAKAAKTPDKPLDKGLDPADVQEQFNMALFSAGLNAAALISPQLWLVAGASVVYASIPLVRKAGQLIFQERRIGIEVLDSAGVLSTIVTGQYVISSTMFLLYAGAQKLRLKTENSSRQSLIEVFEQRPEFVWVLANEEDDVEIQVPFEALRAGDIVVVNAGGPVPADGVVIRGFALVDQHLLTGEAQPAEKGIGDQTFASTIVISGRIYVRVETAGRDTVASEIGEILQNTANFTASIESQGQKIADATVI